MGEPFGRRRARGQDRTQRLSVRLSEGERLALRARARAREVSVTRLLVDAALEVALPAPRSDRTAVGEPAAEAAAVSRRRLAGEGRAQLNVKLSAGELDELRGRAAQRGVSVSALLVGCALERALPAARPAMSAEERAVIDRAVGVMDDLIAELSRVGNNINQLAHVANISREVPVERLLREALGEASAAVGLVREVADELARSARR
ncbi:MAG: plasmid mobilization protein [Solirubrobacteraceae bacterium]